MNIAAMFQYLDELRESGATNMFGAAPYVVREFGLSKREARDVLLAWIQTYKPGVSPYVRAAGVQQQMLEQR